MQREEGSVANELREPLLNITSKYPSSSHWNDDLSYFFGFFVSRVSTVQSIVTLFAFCGREDEESDSNLVVSDFDYFFEVDVDHIHF